MPYVELQKNKILIGGKPVTLLCASLFYFRLPAERWEARMRQLRMCGYNCIDVYMPWNFHELRPGEWRFDGMRDVARFLDLASANGLYVIARPGPYICSEWDGGALPAWLYGRGVPLRQNDPDYLALLDGWLEKILPIVAAHEAGRGGSVVAVQLENEMDFFPCREPNPYIAHMVATARRLGVSVPLTTCAGQCDAQGASGDAEGIAVTFNAYTPPKFPALELLLSHMRSVAADRGAPLMITETDREHAMLKREIMAGARLVAPYNQVGGTNVDMTNGISNWSTEPDLPLALMATDYDFVSMITADGRLREEAKSGRLLGCMLASLGEQIAAAEPCPSPIALRCDFPAAVSRDDQGREAPLFPALRMPCGWLLSASNLGERTGILRFEAEGETCTLSVEPGETAILPYRVDLAVLGGEGELLWSEAEWCGHRMDGNTLEITLSGGKNARACVRAGGTNRVVQGPAWQSVGARCRLRILEREDAVAACPNLPPLTERIPSAVSVAPADAPRVHPVCLREHAAPLGDGIRTMEAAGQYRGDAFYEFDARTDDPLLLLGAADLLWATHGETTYARYADGSSLLLPGGKGKWQVRVQSWGHANFDDIRQPALKMGSAKGLRGVALLRFSQDVSDAWLIYPEAKYAAQGRRELRDTDRIMATTVNSWSFPASPMTADYVRKVYFPANCDSFFLHVPMEGVGIEVYVDGVLAAARRPHDPWMDLTGAVTPGRGAEVRLRVTRHFSHDPMGAITLYGGSHVAEAAMSGVTVDAWQALPAEGEGEALRLPLVLRPGEERMLTRILPNGPARDRVLVLEGAGVEATLLAGGYVCGRVVRPAEGYPQVKGGSARRVYLPAEWQKDVRLHLTGLGEGGRVEAINWESVEA